MKILKNKGMIAAVIAGLFPDLVQGATVLPPQNGKSVYADFKQSGSRPYSTFDMVIGGKNMKLWITTS
jgi:hypothetical protein